VRNDDDNGNTENTLIMAVGTEERANQRLLAILRQSIRIDGYTVQQVDLMTRGYAPRVRTIMDKFAAVGCISCSFVLLSGRKSIISFYLYALKNSYFFRNRMYNVSPLDA
jgi:hypothetical protein